MSAFLGQAAGALAQVNAVGQQVLGLLDPSLSRATLRGLPFWVPSGSSRGGRRWVTHEFPARDEPWHEDLGQATGAFEVEGLLVGEDATAQAADFQEAINAPGFATLTHPWWGEVEVAVLEGRVALAAEEGRLARISLRLERAGRQPAPAAEADGLLGVLQRLARLRQAVLRVLGQLRQLAALPRQLIGALRGIVAGIGDAIGNTLAAFAAPFPSLLPRFRVMDDATLARPALLAPLVFDGYRAVSALAAPPPPPVWPAVADVASPSRPAPAVLAALLVLAVPVPLPASATLLAPWQAACCAAAASEAARVLAVATYATRIDALAARDAVAEALRVAAEALAASGMDEARVAMLDLRAATVADASARAAGLPALRRLTPAATLPAALLAYQLDGDALGTIFARADDLAARNRVRHPLFVPGGRALEVAA